MYLSGILIDFVSRTGKNYYHQVFLEECQYVVKEKTCLSILLTTDDSGREDSNEGNSEKKYFNEEN